MDRLMCDLTIDYFNDQLSPQEKEAFEEHLISCTECQQELAEWHDLAEDLPFVSEMIEPPDGMKQRILSSILEDPTDPERLIGSKQKPSLQTVPQSTPVLPFETQTKRRSKVMQRLMPLAAAALVLSLMGNAYLGWMVQDQQQVLEVQRETVDQLVALVNLQPLEGNSTGTASIVRHGDEIRVVVQASSLPELSNDEVYQVWLIDEDGPDRAGTFTSTGTDGTAVYTLPAGEDFSWDQIAVSHEPNKDSEQPLGQVLMASAITTTENE